MSDRRRVFLLVLTMVFVAIIVSGISITLLYRVALIEERARLTETAQSQARLIESIARYDEIYSKDYPGGSTEATIFQISDSHENYIGFGKTGEFTLAKLEDGFIIFLLRHRHADTELPQPVSITSDLAEPMRLALSGQSGTIMGLDYRGEKVLAAYEPVAVLDLGIVAKIDLKEVQAPFLQAGIIAAVATITVVSIGAIFFFRITETLLKGIMESETKFRGFMDASTEAYFLFDDDLNYVLINEVGLGFFPSGTKQEDIIGKNILEIDPNLKETGRYDQYKKVIGTGEPFLAENIVPNPKFGDVYLAIQAFKVGQGLGVVISNVTEKVRAEGMMRLQSQIISNMDEGVYLIRSKDGIIVYTNPAFEKLFGYDPNEMIGKHVSMVNAPSENDPEETVKVLSEIINKDGGWQGEILNKRKDDSIFWSFANVTIFDHSEHGKVWISVHKDITEKKREEAEKIKLDAYARQQQKLESIGILASGVAHEINNPITGIMNYAQLISERIDPTQKQLKEFSEEIVVESNRVAEIVRNLLTFSRDEKQDHSPARITDIVEQTLSLIRTIIKRDQIELNVDIPDNLPDVKCRSQQIQQVLMNLLTNARDALNLRYPEYNADKIISVKVRQFEKDGRRWLRTTIEDHGGGIPPEIKERIFDPFFTTKDRALGTGLGLSISLGIVKDHHGELTFKSVENEYTRFYLDLPVDNGWDFNKPNVE